jgi:hypothetical protein
MILNRYSLFCVYDRVDSAMLLEKMFLCCGIVIPEIKRGNGTRRIWFEWN